MNIVRNMHKILSKLYFKNNQVKIVMSANGICDFFLKFRPINNRYISYFDAFTKANVNLALVIFYLQEHYL